MQPNNPSPAPPPIQPGQKGHDPYGFITDPGKPVKKKLLPNGGSKQGRIMIVVGGIIGLALVGVIGMVILSSVGNAQKQEWLSLAQQHQELIRLSDVGLDKAQSLAAKNSAATTKLSLTSSQAVINNLAKRNGATFTSKTLTATKSSDVDGQLKTAEQTNQFDKVFSEILDEKLLAYQGQLQKLEQTSSGTTKASLAAATKNAELLQKQ